MSVEENKAVVQRYIEMWRTGNGGIADEIIADDYIDHSHPNWSPGNAGLKDNLRSYHTSFSEVELELFKLLGEGDTVVFRFALTATHTGKFGSFPATGKRVSYTGINMIRLANGKMAEMWSSVDTLGWVQQLGGSISLPQGGE